MELAKVSLVSSIIAISVALSASAEIIVPENPVNEVLGHVVEVTATYLHDDAKTTLFDGNCATRWIVKPKPDPGTGVIPTVILELDGAIVVNAYRLCGHTGESTMSRHPKWFKLFGLLRVALRRARHDAAREVKG